MELGNKLTFKVFMALNKAAKSKKISQNRNHLSTQREQHMEKFCLYIYIYIKRQHHMQKVISKRDEGSDPHTSRREGTQRA